MAQIVISVTHGKDNSDKATVGLVVANAAAASGQDAILFLSTEGSHLAAKGYAEGIAEEGFKPAKDLITDFRNAGGKIWVCSPCYKKRKYAESDLIEGATIVGGAKVIEVLAQGGQSISY